jgi:hypothetical protein
MTAATSEPISPSTLFCTPPPVTLREFGRRVDRDHDVVGNVRDETSALLGVGMATDAAR